MLSHRSLLKSFTYSFEGLIQAIRQNQNLRIHMAIAVVVIILGLVLKVSPFGMGILAVLILLVIMAEMVNTALEEMVDLIVTEHRRQAKIAKDVASGMVLVAAIGSAVVGAFIFLPHVLKLLG